MTEQVEIEEQSPIFDFNDVDISDVSTVFARMIEVLDQILESTERDSF